MTDLGLTSALPDGYAGLLNELKAAVQDARVRAARSVNRKVLDLYWRIGRLILNRQHQEGWGTKVIERLSADLRAEFPGMRGEPRIPAEVSRVARSSWSVTRINLGPGADTPITQ